MYLFLFLLLPLSFAAYCLVTKDKKIIPAAVIGFLAAVLVCGFKLFFMHAHRIVPYSFSSNFVYYLIRQSLLPVLILHGLFFAISRDTAEYKINNYLPLVLCFYMAYLPYSVISTSSAIIPAFLIFVKPIVYLAMIFQTSIILKMILRLKNEKKYPLIVVCVCLCLVYLIIPALIESLYIIGTNFLLLLAASFVYSALPACYGVAKIISNLKS